MSNPFDEIRSAISHAEMTLRAADQSCDGMARLMKNRLRHVTTYQGVEALKALKSELRDFNAVTGQWKQP